MNRNKIRLLAGWAIGFFAVLLAFQFFYFFFIYKSLEKILPADFDLVLTYSDSTTLEPALVLALSHHKPLYVSQAPWEGRPFPGRPMADLREVYIDPTATTTDQNARRAAQFIRQGGYRKVVLDVSWAHVPRSLFLTRLYLMGSGVSIIPCSTKEVPSDWWHNRALRVEMVKFWGSIGRVALAAVGFETGPRQRPV
jgi:hypothetical protein